MQGTQPPRVLLWTMFLVLAFGTSGQARTPAYVCKADPTCQTMTEVCINHGLYRPRRCRRTVIRDCKQLGVEQCARELAAVCQHISDPACPTCSDTTTTTLPPNPNCPADYPVNCGNGYCCPADYP